MKRLAALLGLALLVCACVKPPDIGIENFTITIQINKNRTFKYTFDGIMVLDASCFKPSYEEFIKKEEEEARKDETYKKFKYVGNNRFHVVFEEKGTLEKTFSSDLISLVESTPGKVALKRIINTSEEYKDWCQKNAVQFGGTLTVKTDAQVLSHNAQTPPWFAFWRANTYVWKITSLDDPAPSMELQLQVSDAEPKAELVNRFDSGREGYLSRLLDATGQVQLTFPDGRTQLLPYRTHLHPVVANGKVYFFTSQYNFLTGVVVYDIAKGWGESSRLPDDLHSNGNWEIGQPSFSPDGTLVAYYVREKANVEMKFALIDLTGPRAKEVVLPPVEGGGNFAEGLAAVKLKGKWGYLGITGKMVIPAQFENAWHFSEGLASVQQGGKWGFINRAGKMIIKPQFYEVRNFSDGRALVRPTEEKNDCGFIDQAGKMVIPPQPGINKDYRFHEGLAGIRLDNKVGFMDRAGKIVIPAQFEAAGDFHEGLARVYVGNKVGFIDQTGKIVIPVQFGSHTQEFANGMAWVWKTGPKAGWAIIDKAGNLTVPQEDLGSWQAKEAPKPFFQGLALAASTTGKWGFMDKTGKFVIPPQYYLAEEFSEGLAAVNVGGKWGYGKWGFIDRTGNLVIPANYDVAGGFFKGRTLVLMDGKYELIDRTGKMIMELPYDYIEGASEDLIWGVFLKDLQGDSGEKSEIERVRVSSWPNWHTLWQSPPSFAKLAIFSAEVPKPPLWVSKSLVEFDPEFFKPRRFLKYQAPEPGKSDKAKNEEK